MARKVKPSKEPTSAAVQEWISRQQAESQPPGAKPAAPPSAPAVAPPASPAPHAAPGSAPASVPIGPPAPISAPPRPEPIVRNDAQLETFPVAKVIALCCVVVLVGGGVFGVMKFIGNKAAATPKLGKAEISQLQSGMTPEQVQTALGKPQSSHDGLRGPRESKLDRAMEAWYVEYYRKGTLLLAYNKEKKLIEVAVGETPDEYYQRKEKQVKALWEDYPETGFIHQDVWRPNMGPGM